MRRLSLVLLIAMAPHLSACAAGRAAQMAPVGVANPIHVAEGGTHTIGFARLLVRVPAGTTIGHHHDGLAKVRQYPHRWDATVSVASQEFSLVAADVLRDLGYNVLGGERGVFARDDSPRARFQLGGTVSELAYDTYGSLAGNYEEAVLGVTWELLDTVRDSVVFRRQTRGHSSRRLGEGSVVEPAFADALRRLLSEERFVALLTAGVDAAVQAVAAVPEVTEIGTCEVRTGLSLPDQIEDAFRTVVVVRPGMTLGSGVIISPEGHILTAAHVVSGLDRVPVRLRTGIMIDADVLAIDPRQDVALLQIPGSNHECLPLGPARVGVGTDLFAIGSPRMEELSYSVSRGVVSGYRTIDEREYIQTDASLNPGNSGGPLLTTDGRIAGVVSWKFVTPGTEGLAFGVPVDVAIRALNVTVR